MSAKLNIFIAGVTGYTGGNITDHLLRDPRRNNWNLTALVRDQAKGDKLAATFGINVTIGTHEDLELVSNLSSEADVVVSCTSSDSVAIAKGIAAGAKKKYEATGKQLKVIHFSGLGMTCDDAKGKYGPEEMRSDTDIEFLSNIPISKPHRPVDLEIIGADAAGHSKSWIIAPAFIFGLLEHQLVKLGISSSRNRYYDLFIRGAIARGAPGMVGEGQNTFGLSHVQEVTDVFMLVFNGALADDPKVDHGKNGFYFVSHSEYCWYDFWTIIGQELARAGKVKPEGAKPTSFTEAELAYLDPNTVAEMGSNCRAKSDHSLSIGWKPFTSPKDLNEDIRSYIKAM